MDKFELWFGYFEGETFTWKVLEKFDTFSRAYKKFKDFVMEQMKMDDDELQHKWGSTRLDIELREGKKKINWVGLYCRETDKAAWNERINGSEDEGKDGSPKDDK